MKLARQLILLSLGTSLIIINLACSRSDRKNSQSKNTVPPSAVVETITKETKEKNKTPVSALLLGENVRTDNIEITLPYGDETQTLTYVGNLVGDPPDDNYRQFLDTNSSSETISVLPVGDNVEVLIAVKYHTPTKDLNSGVVYVFLRKKNTEEKYEKQFEFIFKKEKTNIAHVALLIDSELEKIREANKDSSSSLLEKAVRSLASQQEAIAKQQVTKESL